MTQTVIGIFDNRNNAEQAVARLVAEGYDRENIDISMHSSERSYSTENASSSSSPDGEGFGDRISRFFSNLFDDEDESSRYTTVAKRGTVITVQTESPQMASRAAEVLDDCGAIDVDEQNQNYSTGTLSVDEQNQNYSTGTLSSDREPSFGASISPGTPVSSTESFNDELSVQDEQYTTRTNITDDVDNRSIPIIEEDLQVGKREMERGGVRLRSRIVERPVEQSLRLREEHVSVDRTPTNRPATEGDFNTFKEGEIEVRERAEVPIVNKEARVVEEVNLRKDVREREETVRDTVRKTEVEIENLDEDSDTLSSNTRGRSKKI